MKQIPLTQGQFALVDDADYEWLNQWKWQYHKDKKSRTGYAVRGIRINKIDITLRMHRIILNAHATMHVDHIDHNGINNQRSNLRLCTQSQNMMNAQRRHNGSSRYKGVALHATKMYFGASLQVNGHTKYLGIFKSENEAANTYNEAAKKYFGEFANLNILGDDVVLPSISQYGEHCKFAKLTKKQVISILERLNAGEKQIHIAKEFSVRQCTISAIKRGKLWNSVRLEDQTK